MHTQLAYPVALGALPKNIIGPDIAIGSHICIYDMPTLLHQEPFLKKQSAQMQPSTAAYAYVMGPPYGIGDTSQKTISQDVAISSHIFIYNWPTLLHQELFPKI